MDLFQGCFCHLPAFRIIVCHRCGYAVPPDSIGGHLRRHHPKYSTAERNSIVEVVHALPSLAYAHGDVIYPPSTGTAIPGIMVHRNAYGCENRSPAGRRCSYICRSRRAMQEHCKDSHQWENPQRRGGNKAAQSADAGPWRSGISCQEVFREAPWKCCKEVEETQAPASTPPSAQASSFFTRQRELQQRIREHCDERADVVAGFDGIASAVEPWIQTLMIDRHLTDLSKEQIAGVLRPPNRDTEPVLSTIFEQCKQALDSAYALALCAKVLPMSFACQSTVGKFDYGNGESGKHFRLHKQPTTRKTYWSTTGKLICYFDRVIWSRNTFVEPTVDGPSSIVRSTPEQETLYASIVNLVNDDGSIRDSIATHAPSPPPSSGNDEPPDETSITEIQGLILRFICSLHCDKIGEKPYRSPVVSFCSMFAIKAATGSWEEPGNVSSHVSALIWVAQLTTWANLAYSNMDEPDHIQPLLEAHVKKFFYLESQMAIGELLRWRLFLVRVSKDVVSQHQVEWSADGSSLTFQGTEFQLREVATLASSLYKDASDILQSDLLLGLHPRSLTSVELKDDPSIGTIGWSFVDHMPNELSAAKVVLIDGIQSSDPLRQSFLNRSEDQWKESAIAAYEHKVQAFLQRLAVLIWITSGQPVREPEFLSATWCNTQRPRSITIRQSLVMIHLKYDKSQALTGKSKDNVRFLTELVGNMLIMYIVYVQPLRTLFRSRSDICVPPCPYLWEKDGEMWRDGTITRSMESACARAGIPRLHISNWRHISVAIVKTKFKDQIQYFDPDSEDDDAEETSDLIPAMTRQRNHKTATVNRRYANTAGCPFSSLWDGLIRTGKMASEVWQQYWGFDASFLPDSTDYTECDPAIVRFQQAAALRPRTVYYEEPLMERARELFQDAEFKWKSTHQLEALLHICAWREQVLAILPTGGGKSLLFMLPCVMPGAAVTVLVIPLVSLRIDMIARLKALGISHLVWSAGEKRQAPLVIVSVEAAASKEFLIYAQGLLARQQLDRIVFDECHLIVTAANYRESMLYVTQLRKLATQFVYLTATLPPSLLPDFKSRNYLHQITVVRACVNRPEILYSTHRVQSSPDISYLAAACFRAVKTMERMHPSPKSRAIFYTQTRSDAVAAAELLGCESYTSESGTPQEKDAIIARWLSNDGSSFIAATQALAEGFDYHAVILVVHLGPITSLIQYAQQVGRCGRGLPRAKALLLLPASWEPPETDQALLGTTINTTLDMSLARAHELAWANVFSAGGMCARQLLGSYLDLARDVQRCGPTGRCGYCLANPPATKRRAESPDGVASPAPADRHDGRRLILQAEHEAEEELRMYQERMVFLGTICYYCRVQARFNPGGAYDHPFTRCAHFSGIIATRRATLGRHSGKRKWLQPYSACFFCLQPQSVCVPSIEDDGTKSVCRFKDIVLPTCLSLFRCRDGKSVLSEHFSRTFDDEMAYMDWLGEKTQFGGDDAIQAVRVTAHLLGTLDPTSSV